MAPTVAVNPFYTASAIPAGLYPRSGTEAVPTFSVKASVVSSTAIPEAVVYAFVKTVFEQLDSFNARNVQLDALAEDRFLEGLTAPLHAGALRYYDEIGVQVPEALRPSQ